MTKSETLKKNNVWDILFSIHATTKKGTADMLQKLFCHYDPFHFFKIKSSKGILCFACISYLIFRSKFCHLMDIVNR